MEIEKRLGIDSSMAELFGKLDEDTRIATALVYCCNSGASSVLKDRYRLKWYGEFLPSRVTLAAKTSSTLAEFCAALAGRLQGEIGGYDGHRLLFQEVIVLPQDRQRKILDILENQAIVCVTIVRANQEARWEIFNAKKERRGSGDQSGETGEKETGGIPATASWGADPGLPF